MSERGYEVRWGLRQVLDAEGITPYALKQQLGARVSQPTVYAYVNDPPSKVDLRVLGGVLVALKEMTGKHFELSDLLVIRV